jgi:hypothetical protein
MTLRNSENSKAPTQVDSYSFDTTCKNARDVKRVSRLYSIAWKASADAGTVIERLDQDLKVK